MWFAIIRYYILPYHVHKCILNTDHVLFLIFSSYFHNTGFGFSSPFTHHFSLEMREDFFPSESNQLLHVQVFIFLQNIFGKKIVFKLNCWKKQNYIFGFMYSHQKVSHLKIFNAYSKNTNMIFLARTRLSQVLSQACQKSICNVVKYISIVFLIPF